MGIVSITIPNCEKCPNATNIDSAKKGTVISKPLAVRTEFLYSPTDLSAASSCFWVSSERVNYCLDCKVARRFNLLS